MNDEARIIKWLNEDCFRMNALKMGASLKLKDWCLAAGFVRNLVWDHLHHHSKPTPLNDIDLIYFDDDLENDRDEEYETKLKSMSNYPWSVKNQTHIHIKNKEAPYSSTVDVMSYWPEIETAIGARLSSTNEIELIAPFGLTALFAQSITLNKKRPKKAVFEHRIKSKEWLKQWPKLNISLCLPFIK